jgi:hypothetical protein
VVERLGATGRSRLLAFPPHIYRPHIHYLAFPDNVEGIKKIDGGITMGNHQFQQFSDLELPLSFGRENNLPMLISLPFIL